MPHSEIHGSKLILSSPWLNAEYHVLHRLLLPRHPPNALIALDLIRKKTDLNLSPRPFVSRGVASDQKHVLFPPLPCGRDFLINSHARKLTIWLVYLTWTTLSLDPIPKDCPCCTHTRVQPTTLIISLNDVNASEEAASDWTGKQSCFPIKSDRSVMVEPNGFEPLTSCLQSRRSTN